MTRSSLKIGQDLGIRTPRFRRVGVSSLSAGDMKCAIHRMALYFDEFSQWRILSASNLGSLIHGFHSMVSTTEAACLALVGDNGGGSKRAAAVVDPSIRDVFAD